MTLFFTEKDMEEIVSKHPELIEEGLVLVGRQESLGDMRVDLLFKDRFGETLVVELKRGAIKREHVGQAMEYFGTLYDGKPVRLMLVGNRVPPSFQRSLEYHGIEWRELNEEKLLHFLEVNDQPLLEKLGRARTATIPATPPESYEKYSLSKLSQQAVTKVLKAIDQGKIDDVRPSRTYCLVYQGRHYPPKFVISKAWLVQYGRELSPRNFSGGSQTNSALRKLGFPTVRCGCGGRRSVPSVPSEELPSIPGIEVTEHDRIEMFDEIASFEKQISAFLVKTLHGFFGENWVMQGVPKEIRKRWLERRDADIKEGRPSEVLMINYADFSDYKEIILYNWNNVFSRHFKDKEKLRVRLDDLNNLFRKKTMHPIRTIYKDEIGAGRIAIGWIKSKME